MNLIKCYFTESAWYQGAVSDSTPVGILWHDTAVTDSAGNHVGQVNLRRYCYPSKDDPNRSELISIIGNKMNDRHWNTPNSSTGVNAFIGKLADGSIGTVQVSDFEKQPWGCGKSTKGSLNGYWMVNGEKVRQKTHFIQFEICDDGYKDAKYFKDIYKEAVEFTAYICKQCNINPMGCVSYNGVDVPTILCHKDAHKLGFASDHSDVLTWFGKFGKTMNDVRKDVKMLLDGGNPFAESDASIKQYSKIKDGNVYITKNFQAKEFATTDSDEIIIDTDVVNFCQGLREVMNTPVTVVCGYAVKSFDDELHSRGLAVDLRTKKFNPLGLSWYSEITLNSNGGIYVAISQPDGNDYTHIDLREDSTERKIKVGSSNFVNLSGKIYKTLKSGDSGARVKLLQYVLNYLGFKCDTDGQFGPKTTANVKSFQKNIKLTDDGIVGPKTWAALCTTNVVVTQSVSVVEEKFNSEQPETQLIVLEDEINNAVDDVIDDPMTITESENVVESPTINSDVASDDVIENENEINDLDTVEEDKLGRFTRFFLAIINFFKKIFNTNKEH